MGRVCTNPVVLKHNTDRVTGEPKVHLCKWERFGCYSVNGIGPCGPDGRLFEKRGNRER